MKQGKIGNSYTSRINFVEDQTSGTTEDGDEIDIRGILLKLWRGKWIIVISTLVAGALSFLLISQYVPFYQASTKVMFDINRINFVNVGQSVVNPNEGLQNQIEVLRSSNLIERVVNELNLDENPEFNPMLVEHVPSFNERFRSAVTPPEGITEFLRDIGAIAPPPPPPDPEAQAPILRLAIINGVLAGLVLEPILNSNVIEISFTSRNPKTAADVANTVASQYIVDQLDAKLEATRQATGWLSGRVEDLRLRVQKAEEDVETERAALSLEAGQGLAITEAQLNALNNAVSTARNIATAARSTHDRLSIAVETGQDYSAIAEFRESVEIQNLLDQQSKRVDQRASLLENVSETHPSVTRIDAILSDLGTSLRTEADRVVEVARIDMLAAIEGVRRVETDLRELETKALEQSQETVRVRQLEREAEASRIVYENFLSRLNETSEQEALQTADARILTPAEVPLSPLTQQKNFTFQIALALGFLSGIGIVLFLDKLNNAFRSPQEIERLTGETVLGTIPAAGKRMRRQDVVSHFRKHPKSSLAESIRSLRTSILYSNVDQPPKCIMFSSSVPREGKSTTSVLVAMTSQQMGKSAIIVDCDLRLPALARLLGADDDGPGLLSVIGGTASLEEAIHRDEETGLDVLMTKPSEPRSNVNAADILSSIRFADILDTLKDRYDLVVLDTPPALVVADAKILSSHADAVIYSVRWDNTPRGAAMEGLKELRSVNAPIAGVVLTLVNEARAAKYSYEGYSYYKGRYTDYYTQ